LKFLIFSFTPPAYLIEKYSILDASAMVGMTPGQFKAGNQRKEKISAPL